MTLGCVAVIDIGKTNAKLAVVDLSDLSEVDVITRPNTVLPGPPWPHFDVEGHWQFLLDGLRRFHAAYGLSAITITTHGASAALLDAAGGLAAPILDYEHTGPEELAEAYDALRPGFEETGAPRLAMGLNVGAQLHWQFAQDPGLRDRVAHLVTYPAYWGHRLTGVAATEATSLGCHTDLWEPLTRRPSQLAAQLGIADRIAPCRPPSDVLGPILPQVADATGLPRDTPVHVGIHDSNASLLPHLRSQTAPFSVVSTGTWVIAMAIGGRQVTLDPTRDTLINVNALGDPVPSARFMGGREHDLALEQSQARPDPADVQAVLYDAVMLLPALVPNSGPFAGKTARWIGTEPPLGTGCRTAAVGFYLAMMTAECLDLIGHLGRVIIEGPFAQNHAYCQMLSVLTGGPVRAMAGTTGTSQGAALLARKGPLPPAAYTDIRAEPDAQGAMAAYHRLWQDHVAGPA